MALSDTDTVVITVEPRRRGDLAGDVIVNGPVTSTKTSKSFVFKVTNDGTAPITVNPEQHHRERRLSMGCWSALSR